MDTSLIRTVEELFLSNLKPGMVVRLEVVSLAEPEPLFLTGVVKEVAVHSVVLRATLARFRTMAELRASPGHFGPPFRLHTTETGGLVNMDDQRVRLFRMVETTRPR